MIKNLKNKKKKKAFTLIELIIVIAIIAILSSIALPKFGQIRTNANENADLANAKVIANAVSALVADGKIDDTIESIELVTTGADGAAKDITEYLQSVPTPKSTTGNFFIKVTNGNAEVFTGSASSTGTMIYPNNE